MNREGAPKKFGNTSIARLIRQSRMTDEEFAGMAGATIRAVQSWRRGEYSPSLSKFDEIVSRVASRQTTSTAHDFSVV